MDKYLNEESFNQIFFNSYPNYVYNLQKKAFENCVKDYNFPFLSPEEDSCIRQFSKKYLITIDGTVNYFVKRIVK